MIIQLITSAQTSLPISIEQAKIFSLLSLPYILDLTMASLSAYSPALTATSSTSRAHTDIDNLPDLDIAMDGVGVPDINDLFNFDEYESANDVSIVRSSVLNRQLRCVRNNG